MSLGACARVGGLLSIAHGFQSRSVTLGNFLCVYVWKAREQSKLARLKSGQKRVEGTMVAATVLGLPASPAHSQSNWNKYLNFCVNFYEINYLICTFFTTCQVLKILFKKKIPNRFQYLGYKFLTSLWMRVFESIKERALETTCVLTVLTLAEWSYSTYLQAVLTTLTYNLYQYLCSTYKKQNYNCNQY